jgi:hypothetical protein
MMVQAEQVQQELLRANRALAALVEDLHQRGLSAKTLTHYFS